MPIIAKTGRKSPRVVGLLALLYGILLLGAVSMVYPFLLMLSGTSKSGVDVHASVIVPAFLRDDAALFHKYTEGFFNESLQMMQIAFQTNAPSFRHLTPAHEFASPVLLDDWRDFLRATPLPFYTWQPAFMYTPVSRGTIPLMLRRFKEQLQQKSGGRIEQLNQQLQTDFRDWNTVFVLPRNYLVKRIQPETSPFFDAVNQFTESLDTADRCPLSMDGYFRWVYLRALYPDGDITRYNADHHTDYTDWNTIPLPDTCPPSADEATRRDWLVFVREMINPLWVQADEAAAPLYQAYLRTKYESIDALNRIYHTAYPSFDTIPLYRADTLSFGIRLADWNLFVCGWEDPVTHTRHILPDDLIHLDSADIRFRSYLAKKYKTVEALNGAAGLSVTDFSQISMPLREAMTAHFMTCRSELKQEFLTRNFLSVADYLLLHGRALFNTVVYCLLSILLALIVNPLAAYALSRYRPPSTYGILLFLMLTMSFPPMVTQIPVFLMLREFNLLNTFWALLLPGMANGFSIFLLKGFFDSLPQDLYDSASLDGAGELTIFWQITMSLSKPILSVIALNAFTLAYTNFMMALLICQDENMWTIMPWLYQLQQTGGQGIIFASLLIAAIPTFLVFTFCQNLIIRGIVVPVEK